MARSAPSSVVRLVPPGAEPDYDRLAQVLLAVAEEVTVAEDRLKRATLEALNGGDVAKARQILERWLVEPTVDVAAGLEVG